MAQDVYNQKENTPKNKEGGFWVWTTNHSKKVIIGLVLFSVLISGALLGAALYNKSKREVAIDPIVAEVAGEKVHLSEYKARLVVTAGSENVLASIATEIVDDTPTKTVESITTKTFKEPVLNEIVELKIVNKELKKRNINISDAELVQEAKSTFKDYDSKSSSAQKDYRDYVRLKIGKNKLLEKVVNWKEGYTLYCYFDRADQPDMSGKIEATSLRAKQEPYAKEYCTKAKERLEAGTSNYQDELAKLTADPVIGETSWQPYKMPFGKELVKDKFSSDYFHPAYDLYNRLLALSNEKNKFYLLTTQDMVNKPKESSTSAKDSPASEKGAVKVGADRQLSNEEKATQSQETKDAMYMLVYIKNGNKGETNDFVKWLKDRWGDYKVKTYIERIKI